MPKYKTKDEVMRLVFKLKALGEHSETPPNEAMLALGKMRALIFKNGITETKPQAILSRPIEEHCSAQHELTFKGK